MPTLPLGDKIPELRVMEVLEAAPKQLEKSPKEQFLLTGSGTWFLQGTHLSSKAKSQGGVIYLTDEWNWDT